MKSKQLPNRKRWENEIAKQRGADAAVIFLARVQARYDEPLGQYLAENHGVAIVPGAFFSPFGNDWIRFSYATPVERTEGAFRRLVEGLESLKAKIGKQAEKENR